MLRNVLYPMKTKGGKSENMYYNSTLKSASFVLLVPVEPCVEYPGRSF